MDILIYSIGTLICLLLLLGLICLAVGAWQDFTGEREEKRELEVKVNSMQEEIDHLREELWVEIDKNRERTQ